MKKIRKPLGGLTARLVFAGVAAAVTTVPAQASDQEEIQRLKALIEELDQRIRVLDRKQELATEAAREKEKAAPIVNAGDKGFGFKSADGQFEYKLKATLHMDYRHFDGDAYPNAVDGFFALRIRPNFEGTLFGKYGFRFTPEFGESGDGSSTSGATQNKARVVDGYIDARFDPAFQLRFGKFKPFVGLERLQSPGEMKFIERSYVSNNILPNRDMGATAFGEVLNKKLHYALGVFNGTTDGSESSTGQDINNQKDIAARLFARPFLGNDSALSGLGVGVAATWSNSSTNLLPSYKTPGQQNTFFSYASGTTANGSRDRWSPQAYYYRGPFGVLAEYAVVRQDVIRAGTAAQLKNDAWQIATSWLLTGEDASYQGVKPNRPFSSGEDGGWGAFELLARYQENNIDKEAFSSFVDTSKANASKASTWGVGLRWYLSSLSNFAFNYDYTRFTGGTGALGLDGKTEQLLIGRYQIAF